MRMRYQQPHAQVVPLLPRDGIMFVGSNQGFDVDPVNPGFATMMEDTDLLIPAEL